MHTTILTGSELQKPLRVLVLGGRGFIGRQVVDALRQHSVQIIVGTRKPPVMQNNTLGASVVTAYRRTHMDRLLHANDWDTLIQDCDVIINCVGILRPRWHETYDRVHHLGPAALAQACATAGKRLIHISALGLNAPLRSGFLRSKRDGEAALRASRAHWTIVRPSLLDGEGGFGARWIRRVARWPIHFLPADATGRIAALDVCELGEAIANLACSNDTHERELELGGAEAIPLHELLARLRAQHTSTPALQLHIPSLLARMASHVCDAFHLTPFSFGHWELLRRDNCPQTNHLSGLLGRAPRQIGAGSLSLIHPAHCAHTLDKIS